MRYATDQTLIGILRGAAESGVDVFGNVPGYVVEIQRGALIAAADRLEELLGVLDQISKIEFQDIDYIFSSTDYSAHQNIAIAALERGR